MVWVVLGLKRGTERVPGGAQLVRRCDSCREETTFYEKEIKSTFRLYFLDVFDFDRDRVMACGACGAAFVTDELAAKPRTPMAPTNLDKQLGRGAGAVSRAAVDMGETIGAVGSELGRGLRTAATDVGQGLGDLASRVGHTRLGDLARRRLGRRETGSAEPDLSPEEEAALRELDGPSELELRFRELERQAKARRDP